MGFQAVIPTAILAIVLITVFTVGMNTLVASYSELSDAYKKTASASLEEVHTVLQIRNATVNTTPQGSYVLHVEIANVGSLEVLLNYKFQLIVDYLPNGTSTRSVIIAYYDDWDNVSVSDPNGVQVGNTTLYPGCVAEIDYTLPSPPQPNSTIIIVAVSKSGSRASYAFTYG